MKLLSFQVLNYRSVDDSGEIRVEKLTSLVGRNEAGKSNLLRALQTLNPPGGIKDLAPIKDFPRQRRLSECKDDTPVLDTIWELSEAEQKELVSRFPRAAGVERVTIGRQYKAIRSVGFSGIRSLLFEPSEIARVLKKIQPSAEAAIERREAALQPPAKAALIKFISDLSLASRDHWASTAGPAVAAFRKALAVAGVSLADSDDQLVSQLDQLAETIKQDKPAHEAGRNWIAGQRFLYSSLSMNIPSWKGTRT